MSADLDKQKAADSDESEMSGRVADNRFDEEMHRAICVIGCRGVGKSAVIKLLRGSGLAKSDGDAFLSAFDFVELHACQPNEVKILEKRGIALLIMVLEKGVVLEDVRVTFNAIMPKVHDEVPCLSIITHCDEMSDLQWPKDPAVIHRYERAGMKFVDSIGCCAKFSADPREEALLAPVREESRIAILKAIQAHSCLLNKMKSVKTWLKPELWTLISLFPVFVLWLTL